MRLSQSQLSTIVLAGIIGQYPFAALAGELVDRVGTWACSGTAAVLFATGYSLFVWTINKEIPPDAHISATGFRILVAAYGMLGLGAVFAYFSAVFSAAKEFPHHNGLAMGTSMALFGLSPLFLSLPSYLFITPAGHVNAEAYIIFTGSLTTAMTTISTFGLKQVGRGQQVVLEPPQRAEAPDEEALLLPKPLSEAERPGDPQTPSEEAPLLPKRLPEVERPGYPQTWLTLLRDRYFWWLFVTMAVMLGSSEMVLGNIASVVTSFILTTKPSQAVSNQVQLLSIANTISRLVSGPLIDILCVDPELPSRQKYSISRLAFVAVGGVILVFCHGFMGFFATSEAQVWILSLGVGVSYGLIWTVIPAIVKLAWGEPNLGRNFGMISYAPFVGTSLWTYLFAFNVERESQPDTQHCVGVKCWQMTFQACTALVAIVLLSLVGLWREWRGRV
ncbi:putative monocarboxylate transporter mch1 [Tulasnella sp. 330]|nr:putative monocarboxylate transporter mch1 [Tulasnella sp. 330]KAG8880035.1 putative monocarboxylate transporter mch1 [Tulasnella sp. 332]